MTVEEILNVAQTLTFEDRKKLIQGLFEQMPRTGGLLGTIEYVGNLGSAKQTMRAMVNESLERTAHELRAEEAEGN
ncbi:MAG: hypothetical protein ACREEM_22100 [Blastocatellia bacterium]